MRGLFAWILVVVGMAVFPGSARSEVMVTIVRTEFDDSESVTKLLHVGDRIPLLTCGSPLEFGMRGWTAATDRHVTRVRLLKRRLPSRDCELEVLVIAERPSAWPTPSRRDEADALPCGTMVVELHGSPWGSVGGSQFRNSCSDGDELDGSVAVGILDVPLPPSQRLERDAIDEASP